MISARKRKEPLPVWEEALSALGEKTLFVLFHGYTGVARLLLSLGLFNRHSLVYPFIGGFQVGCAGCRIIALQIRPLTVQQVHVRHGIVVIRPQLKCLFQHRDAILNDVRDLLPKRVADFLIFQCLFWFQSQLGALFHAGLIRLGPVDHTDRVVGFGVVGVEFTRLAIILLGILKYLYLQIKVSDPFDAIDILGITLQHCFVLVNGLLGHAIVILGIGAGDVLLGVGSRQIEASINQAGVE